MNSLTDRIAQFRKMATDDPENELGHFRLGQLLMEDNQPAEAVKSFERTLELSPQFSKVYQLLGEAFVKLGDNAKAIETMTKGYAVADERGDKMPRDAMGMQLAKLGAPIAKAIVCLCSPRPKVIPVVKKYPGAPSTVFQAFLTTRSKVFCPSRSTFSKR